MVIYHSMKTLITDVDFVSLNIALFSHIYQVHHKRNVYFLIENNNQSTFKNFKNANLAYKFVAT